MGLEAVAVMGVAAVVADRHRQEVELDVRPFELVAAADEAAGLELVAGTDAAAEEQPLGADRRLVPPLERRVQRHRLQTLELQVHLQVVLQVLAYAGQLLHQRDAELLQQRARADPRTLQDLRRGDGAAAQQHFAARARNVGLLAAAQITNADGTLALEQHAVGDGMGVDGQVRPLLGLVQITARRAGTPALGRDGAIHRAEAFLLVAVEVIGTRIASLHAGFDHGMEQLVVVGLGCGHADRAIAAVVVVGADVARLGLAEVRQAVEVGPVLQPRCLGPVVVVQGVAADVAHAVDQRGTTQALAAAAVHAAVVHVRFGIGLVGPVVARALQRIRQRRRHLGAEIQPIVRAAGFQQQHADVGVLGQARGEHVTRRAGADDDVVIFHGSNLPQNTEANSPSSTCTDLTRV